MKLKVRTVKKPGKHGTKPKNRFKGNRYQNIHREAM